MTVYRVKDWDSHFENYKSRDVDSCGFVCVPNKQHGVGLTMILAEPDGAGIYGIWCLILGACSRQRRPRDGWLTDDGKASGKPWTVGVLALRWRRTTAEMTRALEFLCSDSVGWIEKSEVTATAELTAASSPEKVLDGGNGTPVVSPQYLEGNGRERREQKKSCTEPPAAAVPDESDPVFLEFPVCHRKGEPAVWPMTRSHLANLSGTFPALDVSAEGRKALGWVEANPNRKKTSRGMKKFIFGWMTRAQERGLGGSANRPSRPAPSDENSGFKRAPITREFAEANGLPWDEKIAAACGQNGNES